MATYKPTTPYKGSLPTKTVKKGSKGDSVKAVQSYLNWNLGLKLSVDGNCGSKTVSAIKKFQKRYGLKQDGIFGAQSLKKAKAVIKTYSVSKSTPTPAPVYKTKQAQMMEWAKKIAADNSWHYVFYNSSKLAHECPICHHHPKGKYHGFNCIGYAWGSWKHGAGLKIRCSTGIISNAQYEKMLVASSSEALKLAKQRIGINEIKLLRSSSGIPLSKLEPGDVVAYFKDKKYIHTALYLGNGLIADCTSGRKDQIKYGVKSYTSMTIKLAFRYTGK